MKRMKLYCLRVLKAIALFVPIIAICLFLQTYLFLHEDHNTDRLGHFYHEEPNTLDFVVIGASEVYDGISSIYAYEYSGLTSFNYSIAANPASLYLAELKEILSRQNPQMILVEVQGFLYDEIHMSSEGYLRMFVESIPMSRNKLSTILEHPYEDKLSCLFPFFKYHNKWQTTPQEAYNDCIARMQKIKTPLKLKGATTVAFCDDRVPDRDPTDSTTHPLDPGPEKYLIEFLEYCRSNDLDNVLFMRFPHKNMSDEEYKTFCRSNEAERIITTYGFPYLNLETAMDDIGLMYELDFYDAHHLNIDGSLRMTEYLCDILTDDFGLTPMEQTEENRARWDESIPYMNAFIELAFDRRDRGSSVRISESPALVKELEDRIASWNE